MLELIVRFQFSESLQTDSFPRVTSKAENDLFYSIKFSINFTNTRPIQIYRGESFQHAPNAIFLRCVSKRLTQCMIVNNPNPTFVENENANKGIQNEIIFEQRQALFSAQRNGIFETDYLATFRVKNASEDIFFTFSYLVSKEFIGNYE